MKQSLHHRRRKIAGRGRAALLWGLALFIGVQFLLNGAMDRWWPEVRDIKFGGWYRLKRNRLRASQAEHPERPLVMMMGSSTTSSAFRGELFREKAAAAGQPVVAFNFGMLGCNSVPLSLYCRRLHEDGVKPALLLVEVSPALLHDLHVIEDAVLNVPGARLADLPMLMRYHSQPTHMALTWLQERGLPAYTSRGRLMNRVGRGWQPRPEYEAGQAPYAMDASGWVAWPGTPAIDHAAEVAAWWQSIQRIAPDYVSDFRIWPTTCHALEDLLIWCKQKGIKVAFVMTPIDSSFRNWFPRERELQAQLSEWKSQYGVPIIDARDWVADDGFSDVVHLLPAAAHVFTDQLADEVLSLLQNHWQADTAQQHPPRPKRDPANDNIPRPRFDFLAAAGDGSKEWTQFLGAGSRGHSSCQPPVEWSETKHVAWKVELPGFGHSSPVIKDEKIWLTGSDQDGHTLRVHCLDSKSGAIVHDIEVFHQAKPLAIRKEESYATPTPILDGDRVYVHFPYSGTACLSATSGAILWKNEDVRADGSGGSSPLLCGARLILAIDGVTEQFLAALDAHTGKLAWKTPRTRKPNGSTILRAYSTPVVIEVDGKPQIVSTAVDRACGYDPATGTELWHVDYRGHCPIPRPAVGAGMLFLCTGFENPQLWAVHAGGTGDITASHVKWKVKRQVPLISSPLIVGAELYMVSDKGIASCLDAKTGAVHWTERLSGGFSASPLCVAGKVYFFNDAGQTFVIQPGTKYELLHANPLAEGCIATPAVADDALFVRTRTHLYRIGTQSVHEPK